MDIKLDTNAFHSEVIITKDEARLSEQQSSIQLDLINPINGQKITFDFIKLISDTKKIHCETCNGYCYKREYRWLSMHTADKDKFFFINLLSENSIDIIIVNETYNKLIFTYQLNGAMFTNACRIIDSYRVCCSDHPCYLEGNRLLSLQLHDIRDRSAIN